MTFNDKSIRLEYINPADSSGTSFQFLLNSGFYTQNSPFPMVKEFFDLLTKVQSSPSFQDKPAMKELVVNNLSREIYRSISMSAATWDKSEMKNILIPITGTNSEAICDLSKTAGLSFRPKFQHIPNA